MPTLVWVMVGGRRCPPTQEDRCSGRKRGALGIRLQQDDAALGPSVDGQAIDVIAIGQERASIRGEVPGHRAMTAGRIGLINQLTHRLGEPIPDLDGEPPCARRYGETDLDWP